MKLEDFKYWLDTKDISYSDNREQEKITIHLLGTHLRLTHSIIRVNSKTAITQFVRYYKICTIAGIKSKNMDI